ncbi:MAG: hypothetical protein GF398_10075 [Chitinivibrionales bacterium]|nr:hypothetical protein [Chitinivibrionales bacterium]
MNRRYLEQKSPIRRHAAKVAFAFALSLIVIPARIQACDGGGFSTAFYLRGNSTGQSNAVEAVQLLVVFQIIETTTGNKYYVIGVINQPVVRSVRQHNSGRDEQIPFHVVSSADRSLEAWSQGIHKIEEVAAPEPVRTNKKNENKRASGIRLVSYHN